MSEGLICDRSDPIEGLFPGRGIYFRTYVLKYFKLLVDYSKSSSSGGLGSDLRLVDVLRVDRFPSSS